MSTPDPPPGWQPPPQPPGGGWQPPPQPGQWPPQPHFQPAAPTSGSATAALVLGICGILVCPGLLSIVALVLGYKARGEIDRSNGTLQGRGLAMGGIVLGWLGLALGLLIVAGIIILAVFVDPAVFEDYDYGETISLRTP